MTKSADFATIFITNATRRGKALLLITSLSVILFAASTVFYRPLYHSEIVLVTTGSGDQLSSSSLDLGAAAGGLASLGSIGLGESALATESSATVKSKKIISKIIDEYDLLPQMYSTQWDAEKKQWRTGWLYGKPPTIWEATKKFQKKYLSITEDKKTKTTVIGVDWFSPDTAADLATALAVTTNDAIRSRVQTRSKSNVDFLNLEIEKISEASIRQSIFKLIETEMKKLLLAQATKEYAFKIIDPAIPPTKKSFPRISIFSLLGLFFGLVASIFYITVTTLNELKNEN